MAQQLIRHSLRASVATIQLSDPSKRNALSSSMLTELSSLVRQFESDPKVRAVVIESSPPAAEVGGGTKTNKPVFCSGHDLTELRQLRADASGEGQRRGRKLRELFNLCSDVMLRISESRKPYVAKVDGIATAAGCQLVASCDLAYATTRSTFATPGVNVGLFCSTPGVALGRTVGRKAAMEMLLTGREVTAEEAVGMGLINRAVEVDELDGLVGEVTDLISAKSPEAIAGGKPLFGQQLEVPLAEAYRLASQGMVEGVLAGDCGEGIDAFLEKRRPEWGEPGGDGESGRTTFGLKAWMEPSNRDI